MAKKPRGGRAPITATASLEQPGEGRGLRIHTQLAPQAGDTTRADAPAPETPRPAARAAVRTRAPEPRRPRPARSSFSDRLLRNSAIACAVLLGILALGNIDQPWAEKAASGIERALTMRINLDDSIGDLTFVREIMPESALVFLNVSGDAELTKPVDGAVSHPWSSLQPWMMFDCDDGTPVYAVAAGTATAVSPLADDEWGLLIDHGDGQESVYAGLEGALVRPGDKLERGQQVGTAGDDVYFEWRSAGESVDPTGKLGLQ